MRKLVFLLLFLFSIFFTPVTFAQSNSFVSIVNPIRGKDFWDLKDQAPQTAVSGQIAILKKYNLPATWLIRFDALENSDIINQLKTRSMDEKGLFLEITPSWANQAKVKYRQSSSWHDAGSAFLTGYERDEREKLIDAAFEKFKLTFGGYPSSVGAWWIDSYSLGYMQEKYGIISVLIVADQYSTDNYQIWGQYFGTPYYPAKNNALHPASSIQNKLPVVVMQWATRDPVNAYGKGVEESTFSVQANDYIDYHNLDIKYFSSLINIYTKQKFNKVAHIVVGLENSYSWNKYSQEYQDQIQTLFDKKNSNQIQITTMGEFASWYKNTFSIVSPEQLIISDDPLGSNKKTIWFMNPYYRVALFINQEGVIFRDIRQYVEGEEELCFKNSCSSVNFATFATRVLDEVTYGNRWVIDEGKIEDLQTSKKSDGYLISYANAAGSKRGIKLLDRDIEVNGKMFTIDGSIFNATTQDKGAAKNNITIEDKSFNWSIFSVIRKIAVFILFIAIAYLAAGLVLIDRFYNKEISFLQKVFLSVVAGFVSSTIIFYLTSLVNLRFISYIYIFINILLFFKLRILTSLNINFKIPDKMGLVSIVVIIIGTIFQILPTIKNGLTFSFGMGFWGPNTHDGIWHISLINQLIADLPVQNPIFAGTLLKNYHFFYDLMIAQAAILTKIPVIDLVFRFYPVLFSLLLGIGTYYLILVVFKDKIGLLKTKVAAIFGLYFVYFTGSFGWIIEYIKQRSLGGESAFWINQSISFNLNPPFAASLLIVIALLIILSAKKINFGAGGLSVILIGSLMGFKAYAAVLVLLSLVLIASVKVIKRDFALFYILIPSSVFAGTIFLTNFEPSRQLITFAPFWFIHSMIDSPDRVGLIRISLARMVGLSSKNWVKLIGAETISLLLFIIGNLGVRILGIFSLVKIKKILKSDDLLLMFLMGIFAFLIPTLVIQSGNPWNTIQFSYYGLYIVSLASGAVLSFLVFKLSKIWSILILVLVLIVAPINSITTATYYLGFLPHGRIDVKELSGLEFLSKQEDGVVLTYPYSERLKKVLPEPWPLFAYDSTAYVSALSNKAAYLEDLGQNEILLTDYKKRLVASKYFFLESSSRGGQFLKENNIKYIYLPKIYKVFLDESVNIKIIFENEEVIIYKVNT